MKKKTLLPTALITCATLLLTPTFVSADSLAHLETKEGIIDIVGYEVKENENAVFIIAEYQNSTEESCSPMFQFNITAYQDGVELETAYSSYKPDGCKGSDTKIKPGATLKYSKCYEIAGTSPIEIEVGPMFNFDDEYATCTFDLTSQTPAEKAPDYKTMYEELKKQFDELQTKYDELVNK